MLGACLVTAILAVLPAHAGNPFCLGGLMAAAPKVEPADLVVKTHRQLWQRLGGNRLSPEVVAKMVDAGDPFSVPESVHAEVDSLTRKLKEFGEMVEARGWNTPAIRARLLIELQSRVRNAENAVAKKSNAVKRASRTVSFSFPGTHRVLVTPDERVIGMGMTLTTGTSPDFSYDVATGKLSKYQPKRASYFDGLFSADGKHIYLSAEKGLFARVPYENGYLTWARARHFGADHGGYYTHKFFDRTGTKLFVGGIPEPSYLCDLISGTDVKITKVDPNAYKGGNPHAWGVIPGTDTVYLLQVWRGQTTYTEYAVDAKGTMTPVRDPIPMMVGRFPEVQWKKDGSGFIIRSEESVHYVDRGWGEPKPILNLKKERKEEEIQDAKISADGLEALVLVRPEIKDFGDRTRETAMRVEKFSLATGKRVSRYELPPDWFHQLHPLADGRVVVIGAGTHLIVDPEGRGD